ncbi:MAG: transposase, partial [Candidatus Poribacteria bacterium]|nr:transposase [Candidatus Poribacteria bacterium]
AMLTYTKLCRRPTHFLRFTGFTVAQFDALYAALAPNVEATRHERLSRPNRRRAIGGGARYTLSLPDRLLMTLCYHRLYVTQAMLGYLFNLDESNICRNLQELRPLLRDALPTPERVLSRILETAKRIGTPEELFEKFPELKTIVDATEQPIPRPKNRKKRDAHYSGRRKRTTKKRQLTTTASGLIVDQSPAVPGRQHDFTLFKEYYERSPSLKPLYEMSINYVDSGYQGIEDFLPDCRIRLIHRARRNRPLNTYQKKINSLRSSTRIKVEHTISRVKKYRIAAEPYRGKEDAYDDHMTIVAGLVNQRQLDRLNLAI